MDGAQNIWYVIKMILLDCVVKVKVTTTWRLKIILDLYETSFSTFYEEKWPSHHLLYVNKLSTHTIARRTNMRELNEIK